MRRVRVYKHAVEEQEGTKKSVKRYVADAVFHGWGVDSECEGSTFTVAIVEFDNGKVDLIYPTFIEFKNPTHD